jgi:4-hydroxythreonine-4-phosphate dehydrogenase
VTFIPRILITPGEPAGIGPDVTVRIAHQQWTAELCVIGSPALLQARAQQLNIPLTLDTIDFAKPASINQPGHLKIYPVELAADCKPGKLNSINSPYVIRCLELATEFCLTEKAQALVTGPVQKSIINAAQIPFTGHTEFLAKQSGSKHSMMLFVIDQVKVALLTTHIPLSQVASHITQANLEKTLRLLKSELRDTFNLIHPRILVCGLNPHAGEEGTIGLEEITIITPVLDKLRAENFYLTGPLPADTIFTPKILKTADVILAMYHDQALPVVKHMGFERAVNVTLGLPFIRTSVDHGTALDIAGTDSVNAGSMISAIELAIGLSKQNPNKIKTN